MGSISTMAKDSDPTKDHEFQRVLGNLLKAPPKRHAEMKIRAKPKAKKAVSPSKKWGGKTKG
jgi:hypothetical protein